MDEALAELMRAGAPAADRAARFRPPRSVAGRPAALLPDRLPGRVMGRRQRQVPVGPDAPDQRPFGVPLGAHHASQRPADAIAGALRRPSGRLGSGARLAAAADGRGRRREDDRLRRRRRRLHAQDVPGGDAERARQRRSLGAVPARGRPRQGRASGPAAGQGDLRFACPARARPRPRISRRRGGAAASAASTWRSPTRSSAPAPTRRGPRPSNGSRSTC